MRDVSADYRLVRDIEVQPLDLQSDGGRHESIMPDTAHPLTASSPPENLCLIPGTEHPFPSEDFAVQDNRPTPPTKSALGAPDGPALDPFNPARLRLDQDFGARLGAKKLLTTVPVRKPSKEVFVRTHPDPDYRIMTGVIELKEDREIYLVDPGLWADLAAEATFSPRLLVTTVTRQGVLSLWPARLPGPDGKLDDWSRSTLEAIEAAKDHWVRVQANMSLGAYDIVLAQGTTAQPEFPTLSMGEILRIAFRDRFVSDQDHPVLRRLRGEI